MTCCRPEHCIVAFGIPHNRAEYVEYVDAPRGRDLLSAQSLNWSRYERQIAGLATHLVPTWRALGVKVLTGLRATDFSTLFCDRQRRVVILISHWKEDTIELFDGMAGVQELAAKVDPGFNGVVDLCVCDSLPFALHLKQRRGIVVKTGDRAVHYTFWLNAYAVVFQVLAARQMSYFDAVGEVLTEFQRPAKGLRK